MTDISKSYLYKITRSEFEPSYYVLLEISKALKIDISEYYKISKEFENLEQYEKFNLYRSLVEQRVHIDEIEIEISKINIKRLKAGIYKQLIYYLKALISCKKYGRHRESIKYCLIAINIKEVLFKIDKIEEYILSEVSFNVLSLIQYNFYKLNEIEKAK